MKFEKPPFHFERVKQEMWDRVPCFHPNAAPAVRFKAGRGIPFYRMQCPDCGLVLTGELKYSEVDALREKGINPIPWNEEKRELYWRTKREISMKLHAEHNAWWWNRYHEYLLSPEWRIRRANILARDGGICRICIEAEARQVHHLTYDRVGEELDEDLVSVCFNCHKSLHTAEKNDESDPIF